MNIKQLSVILLLILLYDKSGLSQGTDMGLERKPGAFVGISAGSLRSQIVNTGYLLTIQTDASGSFAGSLEAGYYFSKYFGLKTGIGYSTCETFLTLDSYNDKFTMRDSENETYELRVTAAGITESQMISVLKIPLSVLLNIPLSPAISIFLEPGINLVFPSGNSFISSGVFTYKGYYPAYNVVLENLPAHGFSTNTTITTDDDLELKQMWTDAVIYSGIDLTIRRKFHLAAGFYYARSISDISGYESTEKFQLSSIPGQVNSLMGAADKVTTTSIGFQITLRYLINR